MIVNKNISFFNYSILAIALLIMFVSCGNHIKTNERFNAIELKPDIYRFENPDTITIVLAGHLYPVLYFPGIFDTLIIEIKKVNPDLVLFLGDITVNYSDKEWDLFLAQANKLNVPFYITPGNHDIRYNNDKPPLLVNNDKEAEEVYLSNIGYRYKLIIDNFTNYILINSNDSVNHIIDFLVAIKPDIDTNKRVFVISHHELWSNNIRSLEAKSWVEKPFSLSQLEPHIDFAQILISGNWGKKFVRTKINTKNNIFEVIKSGNRIKGDKLFFTELKVTNDSIIAHPIIVPINRSSAWFDKKKLITDIK